MRKGAAFCWAHAEGAGPRQGVPRSPGLGSAEPANPAPGPLPARERAPRSPVPAELPSSLPARTRKRKGGTEAA